MTGEGKHMCPEADALQQRDAEAICALIKKMQSEGATADQIVNAVKEYLKKHGERLMQTLGPHVN